MILTVDIGNTTVSLALCAGIKVLDVVIVETDLSDRAFQRELLAHLGRWRRKGFAIKWCIICSVVPEKTKLVERMSIKLLRIKAFVVGADIKIPMPNRYRNPRQVGQDRLVGAFAALRLYGKPTIVVDLGTAITFDVVSRKAEYLGGIIVPGLRLSAESLFLKTALLPKIEIKAPRGIVGRTTEESMLSGLFYGYGSLCRGLIHMISRKLGVTPKVVMTGGHTVLMKRFVSPEVRVIDEHLVHKGMAILLQDTFPNDLG